MIDDTIILCTYFFHSFFENIAIILDSLSGHSEYVRVNIFYKVMIVV